MLVCVFVCALCTRDRGCSVARMRNYIHRHCERSNPMCRHKERVHCFASLAMTWRGRSALNTRTREHHNHDRTNAAALSSQAEHFRATPRRTAVEIATCPRQCAVALRSNFCRHTHRMVNPQANVLTSAKTSLADGSLRARSRPLPQRCVTMPVRSVRYRARRGLYECSTLGDNK